MINPQPKHWFFEFLTMVWTSMTVSRSARRSPSISCDLTTCSKKSLHTEKRAASRSAPPNTPDTSSFAPIFVLPGSETQFRSKSGCSLERAIEYIAIATLSLYDMSPTPQSRASPKSTLRSKFFWSELTEESEPTLWVSRFRLASTLGPEHRQTP
jgi:hypothetical protein